MTIRTPIDPDLVATHNASLLAGLTGDHEHLCEQLERRRIDPREIRRRIAAFAVALPSWAVGTGGTRFARYPVPGEPRNVFEKFEDCGVIQQLVRATPTVSVHFPWDRTDDLAGLREHAAAFGLAFDAVNSNTFQDQPGQQHSYKFGSLTHVSRATREQAIAHNLEVIEAGRKLGSRALTLWIGDGSNFPGQQDFGAAFDRYVDSARHIYAALPDDWQLLLEHKLYEPALYSTVIQDWGSSLLAANALGPKARCLVDLGHHAPSVNIEMIVARLYGQGKLGGFHFNSRKYADDDLIVGTVNPFELFLIFNELVAAAGDPATADCARHVAYMIDQSHNIEPKLEAMVQSVSNVQAAYARALLVDRQALAEAQGAGDVLGAYRCLTNAYETDVRPLLAQVRREMGLAPDPLAALKASGYEAKIAAERGTAASDGSSGYPG